MPINRMPLAYVACAMCFTSPAAAVESNCTRLAQADATGIVLNPASYSTAAARWVEDPVAIPLFTYDAVQIEKGDTVWGKLAETALLPDRYNLEVVAALNPGISDLSVLPIGQSVNIPSRAIDNLDPIDGFKFWPALASEWSNVDPVISEFDHASALVREYSKEENVNAAWEEVISLLDEAKLAAIHTDLDNFSGIEQIISAYQGAKIVSDLLEEAGRDRPAYDPDLVFAVAITAAAQSVAPRVGLVVRTYSTASEKIEGLRLYLMSRFEHQFECWRNARPFQTLSFEARITVNVGNWVIWAQDDTGRRSRPMALARETLASPVDFTVVWD